MAQQRHKIIRKRVALRRDKSVSVVTVGIVLTPTGDPPVRIYIFGNDGITLSREPPAAVSEGEIVVASSEELHAAPLNGRRLLALWNALPGVEKRRKVGDRDALIDQLWSAIEALPEPHAKRDPHASRRRVRRHDGQQMRDEPKMIAAQPPLSALRNV